MYFNNDSNIRVIEVSNQPQLTNYGEVVRFMPGGMGSFPGQMGGYPGGMGSFPGQMGGYPGGMDSVPGQGPQIAFPQQSPSQPSTPQWQSQTSGQGMQPTSPAPTYTPQKPQKAVQGQGMAYMVEAPSMGGCIGRWVYIWPTNGGPGYWMFLVYVGQKSIAGYLANGLYFGLDTTYIDAFVCA